MSDQVDPDHGYTPAMTAGPSESLRRAGGGVRERLLRAAEECFGRFGVAKTTMEDVAKAASVSRATLYRHFADREALVVAAVERRALINVPRMQAHIQRWPTFADRLVEGLIYNIDKGSRDPVVQLLIVSEQHGLVGRTLGGHTLAEGITLLMWEPIFLDAITRGEMRSDLDLRAAARWIAGVNLLLLERDRSVVTEDALREELRTFVLPAFLP